MADDKLNEAARARAYRSGREIVEALAGLTGEEGEIVCQEDALIAEIDFALQSEREAAAAEARRVAIEECAKHLDKMQEGANAYTNLYAYMARQLRALASPAPQEEKPIIRDSAGFPVMGSPAPQEGA